MICTSGRSELGRKTKLNYKLLQQALCGSAADRAPPLLAVPAPAWWSSQHSPSGHSAPVPPSVPHPCMQEMIQTFYYQSLGFLCPTPSLVAGLVAQSCPALCHPVDCSLPGSSVHGMSQAWEWVATSFSGGSSQPRDRTCGFCTASRFFITETPGKPAQHFTCCLLNCPQIISCYMCYLCLPGA